MLQNLVIGNKDYITWYRPRLIPRKRKFGNQKNFHLKICQNVIFSQGKKNPCAPTCPQLLMDFLINVRSTETTASNLDRPFLLNWRNRDLKVLDLPKINISKSVLKESTFPTFLNAFASKICKNITSYSNWSINHLR